MEATERAGGPVALERELCERLVGRRLVAEIGIDVQLYRDTTRALDEVLRNPSNAKPDRLARMHPALLATYLVAHGVYKYAGGTYWSGHAVKWMDRDLGGRGFEMAIESLGLETFANLLDAERAQRFVTPILAHGGIPKYCLDDFFTLLLKDLGAGSADANDLLTSWRTRKTRFQHIDRPVQRFLLNGGELAIDFIDRCIDLVREHGRSGTVLSAVDAGLPSYVVKAFEQREDKEPSGRSRPAATAGRPVLRIDPWSATGPEIVLPGVGPSLAGAAWHIHGDRPRRVPTSTESSNAFVGPAAAWTVELVDHTGALRRSSFEGLDPVPAVFFNPSTGSEVNPSSGLRLASVWALFPEGVRVTATGTSGGEQVLTEPEELPEPTGDWSGYDLRAFDLTGVGALRLSASDHDAVTTIRVLAVAERPVIADEPVPAVATQKGLEVYSAPPVIRLPSSSLDRLDQWRVRLALPTRAEPLIVSAADVADSDGVLDLVALVPAATFDEVDLVVQGPLGSDLRSSFQVVPGLELTLPDRLLFPGDRSGDVSVRVSPGLTVDGRAGASAASVAMPEHSDQVVVTVADGASSVELRIRVPRLLWGVTGAADPVTELSADVRTLAANEVVDGDVTAIVVQTGRAAHPLQLSLDCPDGRRLQQSDEVKASGIDGRWVFDLGRFSDTIRVSDESQLAFTLHVGARPLTIARVRASLEIGRIQATTRCADSFTAVRLEYDEARPMKDRVARLWPLDRPWADPITESIPDDQVGFVELHGHDRIPAGHYLAEVAIDDGWGRPQRPRMDAAHTGQVTVGDAHDRRARLDALDDDDPIQVLELAAMTGRIARHLDEDELRKVAPMALAAALWIAADNDGRGVTSPGFDAIASLLLADATCFATTITEAVVDASCSTDEVTRMVLAILHRLEPPDSRTSISAAMRGLWETCPAVAIRFDLTDHLGGEQAARCEEFMGWAPDSDDSVPVGAPVGQQFVAIGADTLEHIAASIDLLPRRILDIDSLVTANFEWLLAEKRGEADVRNWWLRADRLASRLVDPGPSLAEHLAHRVPPRGTMDWAAVPHATLALSTLVVTDHERRDDAVILLLEAFEWAPRLVSRDIVLASLLAWLDQPSVGA